MSQARQLITVFHEINRTGDRNVARFTPSLVGMFGSTSIFDSFLTEIDGALAKGQMSAPLKKRAINLIDTFIPQVAEYNGIKKSLDSAVTAAELAEISPATLQDRRHGVSTILSSLILILKEAGELNQ